MIPHLRPGCPLRDTAAIRAAASWCTELGRWRLPDISSNSSRIPLPPAATLNTPPPVEPKADVNNNNGHTTSGSNDGSLDEESAGEDRETNIADVYFKRNRIDKILQRVREAKSFDTAGRLSKSGSSSEELQATPINQLSIMQQPLQLGALGTLNGTSTPPRIIGGWVQSDDVVPTTINGDFFKRQQQQQQQQQHPRILEALHPATTHRLPNPIS